MEFLEILLVILIVAVLGLYLLYLAYKKKYVVLYDNYLKLEHSYRSMYIKHGNQFESFVPFMESYPGNKENTVFIGKPVDFISFDDDYVRFIEVKTGKSKLNEKQQRIKTLIEDKKVKWHELKFEK